MKLDLDFNSDNRVEAINQLDLSGASARQLDLIADYVLASVPKAERDFNFTAMRQYFGKSDATASLEAVCESGEAALYGATSAFSANPLKPTPRRSCLKRSDVEAQMQHLNVSEEVKKRWYDLWQHIDTVEYVVQRHEAIIGKRRADLPIRQELRARIEDYGVLEECEKRASSVDPYEYLKLKRQLVELRKEQYVLLDSLKGEKVRRHAQTPSSSSHFAEPLSLPVYPFDAPLMRQAAPGKIGEQVFAQPFTKVAIEAMRHIDSKGDADKAVDFRQASHVRAIIANVKDLDIQARAPWSMKTESARQLLAWFAFYIRWSGIIETPELRVVLRGKMEGKKNAEIAADIKAICGKDYKPSYVSILYARRVLTAITEAAQAHERLIEYILMGRKVFKVCATCGAFLPRNSEYFYKRQHSNDGYSGSCKSCIKGR